MAQWILACKEINGSIYVSRVPKSTSPTEPGIPDGFPSDWFFVGPGNNPSIQEYSGNEFILTFDYLSHLFIRVFTIATWPPTQVNPVQISGGPNPPNPISYNIELAQDALLFPVANNSVSYGVTAAFYNPVILKQPLVFDDPYSNTFSATLTPVNTYVPQVPAGGWVPYYRLYRRTFTPSIGAWTLIMDWTPNTFSFVDSNTGSLRFQYSAVWGTTDAPPPAPVDAFNPIIGGSPGDAFITVDSTIGHLNFQFFLDEPQTLERQSVVSYGVFSQRLLFVTLSTADYSITNPYPPPSTLPQDFISLPGSLIGRGSNSFASFGARAAFVFTEVSDNSVFPQMGGVVAGPNNFKASSFSFSFIGA